jgi:hypothetical protein
MEIKKIIEGLAYSTEAKEDSRMEGVKVLNGVATMHSMCSNTQYAHFKVREKKERTCINENCPNSRQKDYEEIVRERFIRLQIGWLLSRNEK